MAKRIQVPVSDELERAISEFAEVSNSSMAGVCASLLDEMGPTLIEMTKALRLVKKAPAAAARSMTETLERKIGEANQLQIDIDEEIAPKPAKAKKARKAG